MSHSKAIPRPTGRAGGVPDVSRYLARYEVTLRVVQGTREGAEYPLRRERLTLGRKREADLVFDDDLMSRVHAAIEFHDGGFRVVDLGSRNGTRLNGEPVSSSRLQDGDRIEIGNHGFRFSARDRRPPSITQLAHTRG